MVHSRRSSVLLATAVVAMAASAAPAGAAWAGLSSAKHRAAAPQSGTAAVLQTPSAVVAAIDGAQIPVRYACRNSQDATHYLTARLTQDRGPTYVLGLRGDTGGLVPATCTGRPVSATLSLLPSAYADPAASPAAGTAVLRVDLEARSATGAGWYLVTGSGASSVTDVRVSVR